MCVFVLHAFYQVGGAVIASICVHVMSVCMLVAVFFMCSAFRATVLTTGSLLVPHHLHMAIWRTIIAYAENVCSTPARRRWSIGVKYLLKDTKLWQLSPPGFEPISYQVQAPSLNNRTTVECLECTSVVYVIAYMTDGVKREAAKNKKWSGQKSPCRYDGDSHLLVEDTKRKIQRFHIFCKLGYRSDFVIATKVGEPCNHHPSTSHRRLWSTYLVLHCLRSILLYPKYILLSLSTLNITYLKY